MDLVATPLAAKGLFRLAPRTVLGALWLQTHFAAEEWDTLLSAQASFHIDCLRDIIQDARSAGLSVQHLVVVES